MTLARFILLSPNKIYSIEHGIYRKDYFSAINIGTKHIISLVREMIKQFSALVALSENLNWVLSTVVATHNCLLLQFKDI